jgi:hypothetical protein
MRSRERRRLQWLSVELARRECYGTRHAPSEGGAGGRSSRDQEREIEYTRHLDGGFPPPRRGAMDRAFDVAPVLCESYYMNSI